MHEDPDVFSLDGFQAIKDLPPVARSPENGEVAFHPAGSVRVGDVPALEKPDFARARSSVAPLADDLIPAAPADSADSADCSAVPDDWPRAGLVVPADWAGWVGCSAVLADSADWPRANRPAVPDGLAAPKSPRPDARSGWADSPADFPAGCCWADCWVVQGAPHLAGWQVRQER